jgi:hypothetical protein
MLRGAEPSFRPLMKAKIKGDLSMHRTRLLITLAVLAATLVFPRLARAQAQDGAFQISYFDNANNSSGTDQFVRLSNDGFNGPPGNATGDICAMIYVFRPDQELTECCGCRVTANALLKLSVNKNLTANPLNGSSPTAGVIKILTTKTGVIAGPPGSSKVCDPTLTTPVITLGLLAWGTHIDDNGGAITEVAFRNGTVSAAELGALKLGCSGIVGALPLPPLGSGHGTCDCTDQLSGVIDP